MPDLIKATASLQRLTDLGPHALGLGLHLRKAQLALRRAAEHKHAAAPTAAEANVLIFIVVYPLLAKKNAPPLTDSALFISVRDHGLRRLT